jgi:hypothetical protein
MAYYWKIPGVYPVSADAAGQEIAECENEQGYIVPETVVERAKAPASAIHGCFEWNDKAAATRYRIHQASELIRNIVTVSVSESDGSKQPIRAFVNIKGESERGYKAISAVISNPGEYAYLLATAKSDLETFRRKYESLAELGVVMAAIQEVLA